MAREPIDEAYVEIKPDLKDFDRDVKRELDSSFDKIEDKLDDLTDMIEKQFDRLIAALDANFSELHHIAGNTFDEIQDLARGAGRSIASDIELGTKVAKHEIDDLADNAHHDFNRIQRDARGSGFSIMGIFSRLGKGLTNIAADIGESFTSIGSKLGSSLGSTIGQVGSSIGTVTSSIGSVAQFAILGTLIPLAFGLAGALSQLAGALAALPAAAGVAFAAILPLILAFHGFSDAIGAVLENDPEKLNEALKKLSPSAANVVKEFQKLVAPFSEIQKLAQEAFFKPLVGTLTQLANAIMPALRTGVPIVAAAFGNLFTQIASVFTNVKTGEVLNKLFEATGRIIDDMTPSIVYLVEVLGNLFITGLPFVERFFAVISKGIDAFATWLGTAEDGGKVTGWLEKAWDIGKKVWEIFKQLSIFFGTLIGSFADEGTDTLNGIADALKKINEYFKSSEGEETLHNLGVLVHWAGNAVVFLLDNFTKAHKALNAFFSFIRGIGPFFASIGHWFHETWDDIINVTVNTWHSITGFISDAWNDIVNFFKSTGSGIGTFFSNLWNGLVTDIGNFISGSIAWIQAFPGMLKTFIVDTIHWVAYQVGFAIGTMIKFFVTDLPNAVLSGLNYLYNSVVTSVNAIWNFFTQTIPALAVNVGTWIADMWNKAVDNTITGVTNLISWAGQLPGRVWNYVNELQSRVNNTISNLWHTAVSYFRNLVNDVINEAGRLPGQVWNAMRNVGSIAYNIGRDIVVGIVNGMRSLAGWLYDQAKNLAHDAWQGAKDALGIASPSKAFAKLGRYSVQGFVEGFDTYDMATEIGRSIKVPLTKLGGSSYTQQTAQTPNVNVGGAQVIAYLQIGDDQLHPVVVRAMHDNPQDVALAAQQGDTELSRRR